MTKKKSDNKLLRALRKTWWFIWEDDSVLSWVVNIILAFVLIKFVVYPVLGLILGTGFPIVAVVSGSMEHDGSFDEWWDSAALCNGDTIRCSQAERYLEYGIDRESFRDFAFKNGFNKGDIMLLYGSKPQNVDVGETIVFMGNRPDPIIHRVVVIEEVDGAFVYSTKGDHNPTTFNFENKISEDRLMGVAKIRIPFLGWVKIGFVKLISFISNLF